MPPLTPNRGYPYPVRPNIPAGSDQIEALAAAVDADVTAFLASLIAQITGSQGTVATAQTTVSTAYTDLTTVGPAVTITTGTRALVIITARISNSGANLSRMSVGITGASTIVADDTRTLENEGTLRQRASTVFLQTGLTAGSNIFTAKYRVAAGTGTFEDRHITVFPFP